MPRLCGLTRCPSLTRPLLVLALVFVACAPYWLYAHPPERTPDGITGGPRRWFGGGNDVGRWDVPPANTDTRLAVVSEIAGRPPPPGPGPLDMKHPELALPQEDRRPEEVLVKQDAKEAIQAEVEPITFALIMWSEDAASEGAILIKSILMYTSTPVHIHILADRTAEDYLTRRLALVKHPRHNVRVTFYALTMEAMLARIEREGTMTSDHVAGVPGLMKLFLHELLPSSVKRAIFVDTDAFFLSDPLLLWHQFATFNATTGVAMPSHPQMFAPQWFDANKICSCVMLLDLERLREAHLMHSSARVSQSQSSPDAPPGEGASLSRPAFAALFGSVDPVTGKYAHIALGDQTFWWALISHAPHMYKHLAYDWEVSACMLDMYGTGLASLELSDGDGSEAGDESGEEDELARMVHTWDTPHQGQVVLPKLVHFNCLEGPRYHTWTGWSDPQNSLTRRWASAVRYHAGYKWLWLNQASPLDRGAESTVVIETVAEPHFADELAR